MSQNQMKAHLSQVKAFKIFAQPKKYFWQVPPSQSCSYSRSDNQRRTGLLINLETSVSQCHDQSQTLWTYTASSSGGSKLFIVKLTVSQRYVYTTTHDHDEKKSAREEKKKFSLHQVNERKYTKDGLMNEWCGDCFELEFCFFYKDAFSAKISPKNVTKYHC